MYILNTKLLLQVVVGNHSIRLRQCHHLKDKDLLDSIFDICTNL